MKETIKYLLSKLWLLILLLILSAAAVAGGHTEWPLYGFLVSYFRFALFVLAVGLIAHFAGDALPRSFNTEKGWFSCHPFEEDGRIYERLFRVSKWKDRMTDAAHIFASTGEKRSGGFGNAEAVRGFIQETCAAEATHLMLIAVSPVILFICPNGWRRFFFIAYFIANLMDIIIQRYNRPRLAKVYQRLLKRNESIDPQL